MDRRHFLALLTAPAFVALLEACGSDEAASPTSGSSATNPSDPTSTTPASGPTSSTVPRTGEARSDVARRRAPAARAGDAAEAFAAFGGDVYRALASSDPTGNLVFSPASIALALSMTAAGARGETSTQMLATLHADDPDGLHESANALSAELEARNNSDIELSIANSLWGQTDLQFERAFLDLLASEYGAGLNLVDYRSDPEAARAVINAWVSDETRGRIPQLLAEGVITRDARLTLVNAIYLEAPWSRPFSEDATVDIDFTTAEGASVTVPAMVTSRSLLHVSGDGWQSIEIPYEGDELAMAIFVPDAGGLAEYEKSFGVPGDADSISSAAERQVNLTLPRFEIDSSFSVGDTLQALGMELAFTGDADFSGITTADSLSIGAVVHQANISVDEHGTEAAAATAVIMETTSAPPSDEPVDLVIDRPFLFAVYDRATRATLFLGRVADPTA